MGFLDKIRHRNVNMSNTQPAAAPQMQQTAVPYGASVWEDQRPAPAANPYTNPLPAPSSVTPLRGFAKLSLFDTVFLIDDSGSMGGSNWREAMEGLAAILPEAVKYDTDGIDVHFLNNVRGSIRGVKDADALQKMFRSVQTGGTTPTGAALLRILDPYLKLCEESYKCNRPLPKPLNVVVVTDGAADKHVSNTPENVIVKIARRLDAISAPRQQVGIQFFVVGHDLGVHEDIRSLDDGLRSRYGIKRDIVDASSLSGSGSFREKLLKILLGGVDTSYDAAGSVGNVTPAFDAPQSFHTARPW